MDNFNPVQHLQLRKPLRLWNGRGSEKVSTTTVAYTTARPVINQPGQWYGSTLLNCAMTEVIPAIRPLEQLIKYEHYTYM